MMFDTPYLKPLSKTRAAESLLDLKAVSENDEITERNLLRTATQPGTRAFKRSVSQVLCQQPVHHINTALLLE
jgi:hypothetical protein